MTARRGRGRPQLCPPPVLLAVVSMHQAGMGYPAISEVLNTRGIPTPAGKPRWNRTHVWRLVRTAGAGRVRAGLHDH
ncbi:recombinase family protein [Nocardia rhamnosiphila]|uniref:recombinase family protein n=1 Tax=Nocardia rhamnosiphila TaxID=426716 RepID=UPI0033FFC5A6